MTDNTETEITRLLDTGMVNVSLDEFLEKLDSLGYEIDNYSSFNYVNNLNQVTHKARSIYIREKDTGRYFAHVESRRDDNFRALQEIRKDWLIVHRNRIWEI